MTGSAKWAAAAILVTATAASAIPWAEHRWLNAAVTAGTVGAAIVFAWARAGHGPRFWAALCCVSAAGAVAALAAHSRMMPECTAVNASGTRVVIGRVLTETGEKYKAANPAEDNSMLLASLGGYSPEVFWTRASIGECSRLLAVTGAMWMPLFGIAAIAAARALGFGSREAPAGETGPKRQAFLSYNHADADAARRLREYLARHGIEVAIDTDSMMPGERITAYIERSIRDSDVVLSLVSNRSLVSAWVAMETIHTLNRNQWLEGRLFVACYLDDDFFRPEFRLKCTEKIDERLREIEELIPEYAQKRIDTIDLNEEKTRLYELRNNLGTILATLKNSLCLDVRESGIEESGERLVAAIKDLRNLDRRAAGR